jgi:hypothetical protein
MEKRERQARREFVRNDVLSFDIRYLRSKVAKVRKKRKQELHEVVNRR